MRSRRIFCGTFLAPLRSRPAAFCPAASVTGMVISLASLLGYQGERRNVAVIEITIKLRARFLTSPTIPFSPQVRVLTSLHVGLGTDADTAFRVPESRHGPTAGRSDASIGFQSGLCLRVRTIWDLRRAFHSILLHRAALPNHFLGNRNERAQGPSPNRRHKENPLVAERLLLLQEIFEGAGRGASTRMAERLGRFNVLRGSPPSIGLAQRIILSCPASECGICATNTGRQPQAALAFVHLVSNAILPEGRVRGAWFGTSTARQTLLG
jgi:hypothetical protein